MRTCVVAARVLSHALAADVVSMVVVVVKGATYLGAGQEVTRQWG